MPVTENLTQSQGLLAELQRLQRRVSEQLAEKETELRGLSGTDTRLDQLQQTLDGLQPEPGRWRAERQALMDRRDELSRTVATAEARWKQTLEAANDNGRELKEELAMVDALRVEQERLTMDRGALVDRVNELEHALEAAPATQRVEEDWNAERTQLLDQLVQLEQALQHTEQQVAEDRDRLLADLNQ